MAYLAITCAGLVCDESYECALQDLLSDTTTDIYCSGDNSCRQVHTIQSTSSADLYCSGAFSCYKASNLQSIDSAYHNPLYCYDCTVVL